MDRRSFRRVADASGIRASAAWPVGSIFISVVSTNPAQLLGFGTWTAFATGRCLIGLDSGQTEFDTIGETGGTKTHTLTTAEMPSHSHTPTYNNIAGLTGSGAINFVGAAGYATAENVDLSIGNTGSDTAHNNLPPYVVVYMWRRVS